MDEFTALFSRKDMTFEEAVAYFKERVPVTASRFYQIAAEYRALAFTVSGYTKAQVLKKFYDELLAALEDGNSLAEFRENMNDFLEAEGYEGITPYQAENIFRTNIQTAYNVGHYKRMTEPGVKALRPYWQYDAVNDSKTRPSHLAMDGRVFMADDPIWDTWFPPNGFKCRCTVKTLSKRQMEQRGLTVETEAPRAARLEDGRFVNILPDLQFDTNPAKVRYQPDLTGYAEDVRVKNKIIRETRKKALQFKNDDIDLEDIQGELDARAKFISVPLDRMVEDKEISSYETTVDESCYDTFLEDETMSVIIRYLSRGYIREVVIDIGRSALSSN